MDNWESKMERFLDRLDGDQSLTRSDYIGVLEAIKEQVQERIDAAKEF